MLFAEADHKANSPDTWKVVKSGRNWTVVTKDGDVLTTTKTKHGATEATKSGCLFELYKDEGRWYAGESVRGWKPYKA